MALNQTVVFLNLAQFTHIYNLTKSLNNSHLVQFCQHLAYVSSIYLVDFAVNPRGKP